MDRTFTIRQLTKEFSVTARALRFYEDENLIAPGRRGQTRIYAPRDRARITLILRGRRLGFSLAEIRELLDLYDPADNGHAQLVQARLKYEERITVLERQQLEIDAMLKELHRSIRSFDEALAAPEVNAA